MRAEGAKIQAKFPTKRWSRNRRGARWRREQPEWSIKITGKASIWVCARAFERIRVHLRDCIARDRAAAGRGGGDGGGGRRGEGDSARSPPREAVKMSRLVHPGGTSARRHTTRGRPTLLSFSSPLCPSPPFSLFPPPSLPLPSSLIFSPSPPFSPFLPPSPPHRVSPQRPRNDRRSSIRYRINATLGCSRKRAAVVHRAHRDSRLYRNDADGLPALLTPGLPSLFVRGGGRGGGGGANFTGSMFREGTQVLAGRLAVIS